MMRIYYWVHHTGRCDRSTGVQRVVRALGAALATASDVELMPVRWCAECEAIVHAERAWLAGLSQFNGPALSESAEAGEPLHLTKVDAGRLDGAWLLLPEVPHVGGDPPDAPAPALPVALDYARYYGLRTALVFYDLVPLRVPGYETMVAAHTEYGRALLAADLILPISHSVGNDLLAWLMGQGYSPTRLPPVRPVPLAAEIIGVPRRVDDAEPGAGMVRFLAVGTVEPRKNQLILMQALNRLQRRRPELDICLDVVGGLHHAVAEAAQREASESQGRIRLHDYLPEERAHSLMRECNATVFLSLAEGYGLPVAESLWSGKPCLCSNIGAIAEIASGGGCLSIDPTDAKAIEHGLEQLADDAGLRRDLTRTACQRALASWEDYGRSVLVS